jgi:23S rRNA (uracil1939-C5)-methyltransferase
MSSRRGRPVTLAGTPTVSDAAPQIFGDDVPVSGLAAWTRHATSFFQGNRWLVGALARRVLEVATGERVVDLYAGVGLFSVVLAARGAVVVAVEGDASSGADLAANAGPWRDRLLVVRADVESAVAEPPAETPDAVVVDPPRTGLSKDATTGLLAWRAPRLVYVSCDPPTLARDAARLVASGYRLVSVEAFDFFPNTPHVETLAVFDVG